MNDEHNGALDILMEAARGNIDLSEDSLLRLEHKIRRALAPRQISHKCAPLARGYMSEGRDWWVGKLTEPVEEYPQESFCLHMKTPIKDVAFLCNRADFEQLALLCRAVTGALHPVWIDRMISNVKKRAIAPDPGERDCPYCKNEREIETDNNGPIGPCPVCRPGKSDDRLR